MGMFNGDSSKEDRHSEAVIDPALRSLASSPTPDKKKQQVDSSADIDVDNPHHHHPTDHHSSSMPIRVEQQSFQMASSPRTRHFVDTLTNSSAHRLPSPPPPIATMSTSTSTSASTDPHSHSPSPSVSIDRSSNSTPHIRRSPLQQGQMYPPPSYDAAPSSIIPSQQPGRHHSNSNSGSSANNNGNGNGNGNGRQLDSQPVGHGAYMYSSSPSFDQHPPRYEHHPQQQQHHQQHHDARGPPIYAVPFPPAHAHPYPIHHAPHQAAHHPHHPVQQQHPHHQPLSHHHHHQQMSGYDRNPYPSNMMQGGHGMPGSMGGAGGPPVTIVHTDDAATKLTDGIRRRCFNCCTTDTSTWRRSNLSPGKVLCNKCGLFERTHSRPRPDQFPHKRGPLATSTLGAASGGGGGGPANRRTPPGMNQLPPISSGNAGAYQYNHQSIAPLNTGEYGSGGAPGQGAGGQGAGTTLPGLGAWHGNASGGAASNGAGGGASSGNSVDGGSANANVNSSSGGGGGDNQSTTSSASAAGTPLLPSSRRSTLDSHTHSSPRLSPRERERDRDRERERGERERDRERDAFHDGHALASNAAEKLRQPPSPPSRASTGMGHHQAQSQSQQQQGSGGHTPPA